MTDEATVNVVDKALIAARSTWRREDASNRLAQGARALLLLLLLRRALLLDDKDNPGPKDRCRLPVR